VKILTNVTTFWATSSQKKSGRPDSATQKEEYEETKFCVFFAPENFFGRCRKPGMPKIDRWHSIKTD
jgi:hypothetical protein